MAARRPSLNDLPFWPRYLSREQAATYVGVSPETFDIEVHAGLWPSARRRGGKGGRITWDRCALDAAADRDSGLVSTEAADKSFVTGPNVWGERGHGKTTEKRDQRRSLSAA